MRLFRKEQNLKSQDSHTAAVNTHLQCTLKGVVVTRKDKLKDDPTKPTHLPRTGSESQLQSSSSGLQLPSQTLQQTDRHPTQTLSAGKPCSPAFLSLFGYDHGADSASQHSAE